MIKLRAWLPGENKFVYSDKECYTCDNELITWGFNEEGLIEVGYISNIDYKYVCLTNEVDRFTEVQDKNEIDIFERDLVLGEKYWCDGYLAKKYPRRIKVICEIKFNKGKFYTHEIKAVPEHEEADREKFYRGVSYSLEPFGSNIAKNLEIIGNVHNKER